MAATEMGTWAGEWSAEEPIQIGYAWAPRDGEGWSPGDDGLEHRELGLDGASGGALGVEHLRAGAGEGGWQSGGLDFDFLYVLQGSAALEGADGRSEQLQAGSVSAQGPGGPGDFVGQISADFEAIRITAPAGRRPGADPRPGVAGQTAISHELPENYARGAGPREYFLYRDLGTKELTDGRIHIHVVRATEPGAGTGWHYHTMAQWFLILGGSSVIGVENRPPQPLRIGDAMCVGFGPQMRHNVTDFTADYAVLEMCVPAIYETIPVEAPDGSSDA